MEGDRVGGREGGRGGKRERESRGGYVPGILNPALLVTAKTQ